MSEITVDLESVSLEATPFTACKEGSGEDVLGSTGMQVEPIGLQLP